MLSQGTKSPTYTAWLIWLQARDRSTGAIQSVGFWTGPQDQNFIVNGQTRTYTSVSILEVEPFNYSAGVENIQSQTLRLNGVTPAVEQAIRYYDARQAKIEIHMVERVAGRPLVAPTIQRVFKGHVDEPKFDREEATTTGVTRVTCEIGLMSSDRRGTRRLHLRKSDATQRMVDPNDAGREYAKSKAKVTWMGETENPYRYTSTQRGRGVVRHVVDTTMNAARG